MFINISVLEKKAWRAMEQCRRGRGSKRAKEKRLRDLALVSPERCEALKTRAEAILG